MQEGLTLVVEGKTKKVYVDEKSPATVLIVSKDDITAGDGAKHDVIKNKAELSTRTTSNVFRLLSNCGLPVAFKRQVEPTVFEASRCTMLPYEVVVRREAHGSYLKRYPNLKKGHYFPSLVLEYFLKTSGKKWRSYDLRFDDPLMVYTSKDGHQRISLYDPNAPNLTQQPASPFIYFTASDVFTRHNEHFLLNQMGIRAKQAFLILEKAWQLRGHRLVDFKVEFGIDASRNLLLADVIDNDSWRLLDGYGSYIDKQVYRDGGQLDTVSANYLTVAELTDTFFVTRPCLLIWRDSPEDDVTELTKDLNDLGNRKIKIGPKGYELHADFDLQIIGCSFHKQPVLAHQLLMEHVQKFPDSVIIACVGHSHGCGPTLAANTTMPVIAVPIGYRGSPSDVWSSLRVPSDVAVMAVPEPSNAISAALQIFAARSPAIYAALCSKKEELADISCLDS